MAYLSSGVLGSLVHRAIPFVLWSCFKDIEKHCASRAHFKYASRVPAPVAVIWGRPHCGEVSIEQGGISLHA